MSDNKLVIRRLPPSMNEEDFIKQISPLPDHDYFCFLDANPGLGPHSYSRAYINFLDRNDMSIFRERFDNYIFLGKDGHEYPAVVEEALWHKSPKSGPFYRKPNESQEDSAAPRSDENEITKGLSLIEQDAEFKEFVDKLQSQRGRPRNSPIQTLENNLDELTNATTSGSLGGKDNPKVITPLIGFINQKRSSKGKKKGH